MIQNTVIYGHTATDDDSDGKRFSQLFRYIDIEFLKKNPNIYLTLADEKLTFEIFAVFYTDVDFYYINPSPSDEGFDAFIKTVNDKNEFIFEDATVTESDRLLTLSGCSHKYDKNNTGNQRFVVMAKLVDKAGSKTNITKNLNPQLPKQ